MDEDIEKERNAAMIDSTDALIRSLQLNGDIDKSMQDKCITTFHRKVRDADNELDTQFQGDMEKLFKSLSGKNKVLWIVCVFKVCKIRGHSSLTFFSGN